MHEGNLELFFPRLIYERGMLVSKLPSKNNGSRDYHGIRECITYGGLICAGPLPIRVHWVNAHPYISSNIAVTNKKDHSPPINGLVLFDVHLLVKDLVMVALMYP